MKKYFKKFGLSIMALIITICTCITLTGCKTNDETQIMTLSVNPSIEFIVDKDDKVISVSANNEDCGYILEKFNQFAGMSAKDAALTFLDLCEEYGFVVEGSMDGEKITISVSGEGAEKLYNDVKNNINSKISELGLTIENMVKIEKEKLENIVAECYQEYSESKIASLTEKELLDLIKQSRNETKDLHTVQERVAYYQERAEKVLSAKISAINDYLNENNLTIIANTLGSAMNSAYENISNAYTNIENKFRNTFLDLDAKMADYIKLKQEYFAKVEAYRDALAKNNDNDTSNDVSLDEIEELKSSMENVRTQAKNAFDTLENNRNELLSNILSKVQTTIHTQLSALNSAIDAILNEISNISNEIQTKINTEIENLKNSFENNSVSPWTQA